MNNFRSQLFFFFGVAHSFSVLSAGDWFGGWGWRKKGRGEGRGYTNFVASTQPTRVRFKVEAQMERYTMHLRSSTFGNNSYAQSALSNKIRPKFCSKKAGSRLFGAQSEFIQEALLVGHLFQEMGIFDLLVATTTFNRILILTCRQ